MGSPRPYGAQVQAQGQEGFMELDSQGAPIGKRWGKEGREYTVCLETVTTWVSTTAQSSGTLKDSTEHALQLSHPWGKEAGPWSPSVMSITWLVLLVGH